MKANRTVTLLLIISLLAYIVEMERVLYSKYFTASIEQVTENSQTSSLMSSLH